MKSLKSYSSGVLPEESDNCQWLSLIDCHFFVRGTSGRANLFWLLSTKVCVNEVHALYNTQPSCASACASNFWLFAISITFHCASGIRNFEPLTVLPSQPRIVYWFAAYAQGMVKVGVECEECMDISARFSPKFRCTALREYLIPFRVLSYLALGLWWAY